MFILYQGHYPAIMCPYTGQVVVYYPETAAGWSRCMSLLKEVQAEIGDGWRASDE